MTTTTEHVIFQDQHVFISTTRLIVHGATYPLANVSSVRLSKRSPNPLPAILVLLLGLALLPGVPIIAILVLVVAGILCFTLKSSYVMLVGSAGGEKSALVSKDHGYMVGLVEHINAAIVARG